MIAMSKSKPKGRKRLAKIGNLVKEQRADGIVQRPELTPTAIRRAQARSRRFQRKVNAANAEMDRRIARVAAMIGPTSDP